MISKGLILMILGMAIVFLMLTILIVVMNLVRVIVSRGKKKQQVLAETGGETDETGAKAIAAVAAAVTVYVNKG